MPEECAPSCLGSNNHFGELSLSQKPPTPLNDPVGVLAMQPKTWFEFHQLKYNKAIEFQQKLFWVVPEKWENSQMQVASGRL